MIQFVVLTPGRKEIIARLPRPRAPRLRGRQDACGARGDPDLTHVFGAEQAEIVLADPASDEAAAVAG